jgi:peptidoglycan glycosyltransferase
LWRRKDLAGFQLPRGGDVTLTVDSELQRAALAALTSGGVTCGAAVVLDARTGAVLASATLPTFEPRALTAAGLGKLNAGSDRAQVNRAVAGSYPPGAVFQIVTAAALETAGKEGLTVDCQHEWDDVYWHANGTTYGRRRIEDLAPVLPHGKIGLADALADSCDIYFAQAAITAGPSALRAVATHFGFEHLPPNDDFGADLPDIGRGQEPVRVSPTEMASVAQTIANHGVRVTPSYRLGSPGASAIVLPPAAADQLADALCRCAATSVLETVFSSSPTPIAGKAGLAETDASRHTGHSWFVGFAPADHPRYAIAVLVENAGKDGAAAAPIAKRILAQAMQGH